MTGRQEWLRLYDELYRLYGDCTCPLKHATPFQLLAAVMLSAQCRDCLLYTSPSPRDTTISRMPSSA